MTPEDPLLAQREPRLQGIFVSNHESSKEPSISSYSLRQWLGGNSTKGRWINVLVSLTCVLLGLTLGMGWQITSCERTNGRRDNSNASNKQTSEREKSRHGFVRDLGGELDVVCKDGEEVFEGECLKKSLWGKVYYDPCNPKGQRIIKEFGHFAMKDQRKSPGLGTLERHRLNCLVMPQILEGIFQRRMDRTNEWRSNVSSRHGYYRRSRITNPVRVFAFAPQMEEGIAAMFDRASRNAGYYPVDYTTADLYPQDSRTFPVDAMKIPFPDKYFSMVAFSHVLEHVPNMTKALTEVSRVIEPGGFALLTCPVKYYLNDTIEDKTCVTEACRVEKFGQKDHIRILGKDTFKVIEAYFDKVYSGLTVDWIRERRPELTLKFANPEFFVGNKDVYVYAFKKGEPGENVYPTHFL